MLPQVVVQVLSEVEETSHRSALPNGDAPDNLRDHGGGRTNMEKSISVSQSHYILPILKL